MPVWLIQILVSLALNAALGLIQEFRKKKEKVPGLTGQSSVGEDVPLSFILGTCATDGHKTYPDSAWGQSGEAANAYLTMQIALSDLPVSALTGLWVNGESVTLDFGGSPASAGYPIAEYESGGADHLWIDFRDGSQTTVHTLMQAKFGAHADRPYSSDMIGRGIADATVTALIDRELFNGWPAYRFEVQGLPLYDPRLDDTAGGTGDHRIDDDATWTFSDNPVVMVYNILTGITFGGQWVWGMAKPVPQSRLPYAEWAAAMDACDTLVDLNAGGTEKRFRAGLEVSADRQPLEVIEALLRACNGRMANVAGRYRIVVGDPGDPVGSFTDADVVVTEPQELDAFPGLGQVVNGATAVYREPGEAWIDKEAPTYYVAEYEAADDGRRLPVDLRLPEVFSNTQAQRITKAVVEDARRFRTHVLTLPPSFFVYEPLDVLAWTSARNGYDAKHFLVTSVTWSPNGNVLMGLKEVDPADHDWDEATDEQDWDVASLTPNRPAAQPMSGWTVDGATLNDASGTGRRPVLQIGYTGPQPDVRAIAVQVRVKATGDLIFDGEQPYGSPYAVLINANFLPATEYEARGKFLPFSGRVTDWSSWLTATTPDVRLAYDDMDARFNDLRQYVMAKARRVDEIADMLGVTIADQDASNYFALKAANAELDATAAVVAAQEVSISDLDGVVTALASDFTGVQATVGDVSAEGLFVVEAEAGGVDEVTLTLAGRLTTSGTIRSGAFQIKVTATGAETRLLTDNLIITNEAGTGGFLSFDPAVGLIIGT